MKFTVVRERAKKVIIVGGGESLRGFDFNRLKNFDGAIIAVNHSIEHMDRADFWITVDPMFQGKPQSPMLNRKKGCKYYCAYPDLEKTPNDAPFYQEVKGVHYLERIVPENGVYSLQTDKGKITTGDSCFGALGLAFHMNPKLIVMLGVDLYGDGHWYDTTSLYNAHKVPAADFEAYKKRLQEYYVEAKKQLDEKGIKVINGSMNSLVTCFRRTTPELAVLEAEDFGDDDFI